MTNNFSEWQDKVKHTSCVAYIVEKETTEKRTANPKLKKHNYEFKN